MIFAVRAEGYDNYEIEELLGLTFKSIRSHLYNGNIKLENLGFYGEGSRSAVHFVYLMAVQFPIKESKNDD